MDVFHKSVGLEKQAFLVAHIDHGTVVTRTMACRNRFRHQCGDPPDQLVLAGL